MFLGIPIKIERISRQRGLKITVLPNATVILRVSKNEKDSHIQKFILRHKNWIENALEKAQKIQFSYPQLSFLEGEKLRLLGKDYFLQFEKGQYGDLVYTKEDRLIVRTAKEVSYEQTRELVFDFYLQAAQRVFPERVRQLSEQTGLIPKKLSLRKQKTLWGSCTHRGHIQLNWKLISAPLSVIDYVIIHELAHLRHPNHSQRFWKTVETYCPDYKSLRKWLKKQHYSFDFLNDYSELHTQKIQVLKK
jgi:predicted metal-dependent hydrolase